MSRWQYPWAWQQLQTAARSKGQMAGMWPEHTGGVPCIRTPPVAVTMVLGQLAACTTEELLTD